MKHPLHPLNRQAPHNAWRDSEAERKWISGKGRQKGKSKRAKAKRRAANQLPRRLPNILMNGAEMQ